MGEIKKKATTTMINERFILKHEPAFEFPALTNFLEESWMLLHSL